MCSCLRHLARTHAAQYVVAFALNQSGSALYFFLLGSAPISLAVPISNSLTLLFTGFAGKLLGERFGNVGVCLRHCCACCTDAHLTSCHFW